MVPLSLAPITINLNSESDTPASPFPLNPNRYSTCFDSHDKPIPRGLTTVEIMLIGGTIKRATFSAFVTPIDFGSNSTKKRVIAVNTTAPQVSPLLPKVAATTCVKIVVANIIKNQSGNTSIYE
jgi:hypothetical protein